MYPVVLLEGEGGQHLVRRGWAGHAASDQLHRPVQCRGRQLVDVKVRGVDDMSTGTRRLSVPGNDDGGDRGHTGQPGQTRQGLVVVDVDVITVAATKRGKAEAVRRPAATAARASPPTTAMRTTRISHDRHRRRNSVRNTSKTAPKMTSAAKCYSSIVGLQGGQYVRQVRGSTNNPDELNHHGSCRPGRAGELRSSLVALQLEIGRGPTIPQAERHPILASSFSDRWPGCPQGIRLRTTRKVWRGPRRNP